MIQSPVESFDLGILLTFAQTKGGRTHLLCSASPECQAPLYAAAHSFCPRYKCVRGRVGACVRALITVTLRAGAAP